MKYGFDRDREPNETERTALESLQEIVKVSGVNVANALYAEATYEKREHLYMKAYQLTYASTGYGWCLCRLVGKRCRDHTGRGGKCLSIGCHLDHTSLFNRNRKPFVLIGQPYELRTDLLKNLLEQCDAYGLDCQITTRDSWHYPGWTLFVEIHRQDWAKVLLAEKGL